MLWFRPKLPVSGEARAWADCRMEWLASEFGEERLTNGPVVLPTPEFFPDPWEGSDADVLPLIHRICGYMGVDPGRLEVELYEVEGVAPEIRAALPHWEESRSGAAGLYRHGTGTGRLTVGIDRARLRDWNSLVATIAHELAHVLLLADGRMSREAPDMEPVTDLATVFLGLGIFTANAAFQYSPYSSANRSGWSFRRQGYLPEETFGYALGRLAFLRGERRPPWSRYLSRNVQHYMRQSLQVLWREKERQGR
jgi:hypothetical protein